MSRARFGAAAVIPALLIASGCGLISDVKSGVDEGINTVNVCNASIELYNGKIKNVQTAANKLQAKPGDAAQTTAFYKSIKTEFGAVHTGLTEQIGKAKDVKVKTALTDLDAQAAALAAKPESFVANNGAAGKKIDETVGHLNEACSRAEKSEKK